MKTRALVLAPLIALLASAFTAATAEAATNLVVNGSFEQGTANIGSFQGWQTLFGDASTFVDSNGQTGTRYGQASDGLWSAFFGSTAASGGATISQSLATTAGQTYLLSFDLANDNAGLAAANALTVTLGGSTALRFVDLGTQGYATVSTTFVAIGPSTLLGLSGYNDASYVEVDRISVTAISAVPEPTTAALTLVGLVVVGGQAASRNRRLGAIVRRMLVRTRGADAPV